MIVIIDVHVDPREVNFSESEELLLDSQSLVWDSQVVKSQTLANIVSWIP